MIKNKNIPFRYKTARFFQILAYCLGVNVILLFIFYNLLGGSAAIGGEVTNEGSYFLFSHGRTTIVSENTYYLFLYYELFSWIAPILALLLTTILYGGFSWSEKSENKIPDYEMHLPYNARKFIYNALGTLLFLLLLFCIITGFILLK